MGAASAFAVGKAKLPSGGLCTRKEQGVHLHAALAECAKSVFQKPFRDLAALFNIGERDAKYRLAAQRRFTAEEVAALLQTEHGIHFLVRLMGDARPKWWTAVLRMGVLGGVARRRETDLRLLQRVADADRTTAAQFPAALLVQDEDFYGPLLAGFNAAAAAGVSDRPVAPASKRGRR